MPEELNDRAQDITEPLLAIAELYEAVLHLCGAEIQDEEPEWIIELLQDCEQIHMEDPELGGLIPPGRSLPQSAWKKNH